MIGRTDFLDVIVEARQDMSDSINKAHCNNNDYDKQFYYGADKMLRDMLWVIEETQQQKFTQNEMREMIAEARKNFEDCSIEAMLDGVDMANEMGMIWVEVMNEEG